MENFSVQILPYVQFGSWPSTLKSSEVSGWKIWAFLQVSQEYFLPAFILLLLQSEPSFSAARSPMATNQPPEEEIQQRFSKELVPSMWEHRTVTSRSQTSKTWPPSSSENPSFSKTKLQLSLLLCLSKQAASVPLSPHSSLGVAQPTLDSDFRWAYPLAYAPLITERATL